MIKNNVWERTHNKKSHNSVLKSVGDDAAHLHANAHMLSYELK